MSDFSHIDPRIGDLMQRPDDARISYIMAEKFIPYPLADYLITEVRDVLGQDEADRYKCLLIFADPGTGKTMIMKECRRLFTNIPDNHDQGPCWRKAFLLITLPDVSDLRSMYFRILDQLGVPYATNDKTATLHDEVCKSLTSASTRILGIDEFHNLLATKKNLGSCMTALRDLANLPLSLLCAGTAAARTCVAADEQLRVRFRCHGLRPWGVDLNTRNFLATLESRLPLRKPSNLASQNLMPLIVKLSKGHIGTMVVGVREAARDAVRNGDECITALGIKVATERIISERLDIKAA